MAQTYDFRLRAREVGGGDWVGFTLGYKRRVGVRDQVTFDEPHRSYVEYDPAVPGWGAWVWEYEVLLVPGMTDHKGMLYPDIAASPNGRRLDLLGYLPLASIDLEDVDGQMYTVKMTRYEERLVEPSVDRALSTDPLGWHIRIQFTKV